MLRPTAVKENLVRKSDFLNEFDPDRVRGRGLLMLPISVFTTPTWCGVRR